MFTIQWKIAFSSPLSAFHHLPNKGWKQLRYILALDQVPSQFQSEQGFAFRFYFLIALFDHADMSIMGHTTHDVICNWILQAAVFSSQFKWVLILTPHWFLSSLWVPACIVFVPISINLLVCQQNCCISRIVFCGKATSKFAWVTRTMMTET